MAVKSLIDKHLDAPKTVDDEVHVTTFGVFACFERCKLAIYVTQDPQITITEPGLVSIWEVVDLAWLKKVDGIIQRSLPAPKSIEKLFAVVDLYYRALAGYLEFRSAGFGGDRYQELPESLTEADAEEIRQTERRVAEGRENAKFEFPRAFWFCDASEAAETSLTDPFTFGRGGPGESESARFRKPIPESDCVELPQVGKVFSLRTKLPSFAGFVSAGSLVEVTAAYRDHWGDGFVNLSLNGKPVVSGLSAQIVL